MTVVIGALAAGSAGDAAAQGRAPRLWLEWPNEGETLYAGPTSLLYKVPVKGFVSSDSYPSEDIEVSLEVLKSEATLGRLVKTPDADGAFEFFLTVNPHGSTEEFPIAFTDCGRMCHGPGDLDLQSGSLRLRVTASDPAGLATSVERNIVVDLAAYATVPVTTVLTGEPDHTVEGVRVSASTWIYIWRARYGLGVTDAGGVARVRVEALSQAPTRIVLRAVPTVVDGVLYQGIDDAEVTLPPGATLAPPATLRLTASAGRVDGQLIANEGVPLGSLDVRAIQLPDGASHLARPSDRGEFVFDDLPIGRYRIAVDRDALIAAACVADAETIDLASTPSAALTLKVDPQAGQSLTGVVRDTRGQPLTFAWLSVDRPALVESVDPNNGSFVLRGLAESTRAVVASAPGYYSRAEAVALDAQHALDIALARRPETRVWHWGDGEVLAPPESDVRMDAQRIVFLGGWLWGEGSAAQPLVIWTESAEVAIARGRFAIEQPVDETGWFYLFEGEATVTGADDRETFAMRSGEMLALVSGASLQPVPLDPAVLSLLKSPASLPIAETWETTVEAQFRDKLARLGVGVAQAITFITYVLVALLLVLAPLIVVIWRLRRRPTADAHPPSDGRHR